MSQILVNNGQTMVCPRAAGIVHYWTTVKIDSEHLLQLNFSERDFWLLPKGLCAVTLLALVGCGDDIHVYKVAKETEPAQMSQSSAHEHSHPEEGSPAALPRLQWTLPAGWEEGQASSMRVGSFLVKDKEGQRADVSIIPLPEGGGENLSLVMVNMWRAQVDLPPIKQEEVASQSEEVVVGGERGQLFDMVGEKPAGEGKTPLRIVVAKATRQGANWFFKMTGDDPLVRQQKPVFKQFLASIKFDESTEPMQFAKAPRAVSTNAKAVPRENSEKPAWVVPPGWQEVEGAQMLVAKFVIPGNAGAKAELNVSQLGGTGGGILPNVNRWRNQLGLTPVTESDLKQQMQSLDVLGGKAMLIEMTGTDARTGQKARLIGAIVPQADQTWFYKLMGNEQVVERERDVFTRFLQTIKYSNVP
jgi:hypothetical protein